MASPQTSSGASEAAWSMVVFTDVDGTLLDGKTHSFDAAREALDELRARSIPVVLVSSKTRAEIEQLRASLRNEHPFIVENGGAILIPAAYFPFPLTAASTSGPYLIIELGTPYPLLRQSLKKIERDFGVPLRGYGDMSVHEIARRTGLSTGEAALAKQRDYDEPFIVEGQGWAKSALAAAIAKHGLRWTHGDRYYHLMGLQDKGHAVRHLIRYYQKAAEDYRRTLITVAVGNSLNDAPMLAVVDKPILVQQVGGLYAADIRLPGLIRIPAPGPVGWNEAILSLLR